MTDQFSTFTSGDGIAEAIEAGRQIGVRVGVPREVGREHDLGALHYLVPQGFRVEAVDVSSDKHRERPRRTHRAVTVNDVPSFLAYIGRHAVPGELEVYADQDTSVMVAIFDAPTRELAAWESHRVTLKLKRTAAWERWIREDGKYLPQDRFAEHLEEGLPEILEPNGLELRQLVQNVEGTVGGRFVSRIRLEDGSSAFTIENNVEMTGKDGRTAVALPKELRLAIRPWVASTQPEEVRARFRASITREKGVAFGYIIDQLEDVLEHAFAALVAQVERALRADEPAEEGVTLLGLGVPVFKGAAPVAR